MTFGGSPTIARLRRDVNNGASKLRGGCALNLPMKKAHALKFDLVSEGIDWIERCGSDTTTKTLWVR